MLKYLSIIEYFKNKPTSGAVATFIYADGLPKNNKQSPKKNKQSNETSSTKKRSPSNEISVKDWIKKCDQHDKLVNSKNTSNLKKCPSREKLYLLDT